jgi:hypothetical protein
VGDGGSGLLCDFVFGRKIKVVGSESESQKSVFVFGQDRRPDMFKIMQVQTTYGEPSKILSCGYFSTAQVGVIGLVSPA